MLVARGVLAVLGRSCICVAAVLRVVGPSGAGEHIALRRPWVVVLRGVGDDQHVGVRPAALHLLPCRAPLGATASVVPSGHAMHGKKFRQKSIVDSRAYDMYYHTLVTSLGIV